MALLPLNVFSFFACRDALMGRFGDTVMAQQLWSRFETFSMIFFLVTVGVCVLGAIFYYTDFRQGATGCPCTRWWWMMGYSVATAIGLGSIIMAFVVSTPLMRPELDMYLLAVCSNICWGVAAYLVTSGVFRLCLHK